MWRRSPIRVRLTLWSVALLGLMLLAFSVVLYAALSHNLYQQVDDDLLLAARQATSEIGQEGGQFTLASIGNDGAMGALRERGLALRLLDLSGKVLDQSGPNVNVAVPTSTLAVARAGQTEFATLDVSGRGTALRIYSVPYQVGGRTAGIVQVSLGLAATQATLGQLLIILAVSIPITLLVAALLGLFLAGRALQPIERITRAAARIEAEHLDQRLDLDLPDDEVGRLARTFDAMLTRLDDAFRRQQQFTADASHELRTPLAIMRGDIDVTLRRPRSPAEYRRTLSDTGDEVERMTRLVEDLLLLAQEDSNQPLIQREPLDLAKLLHTVAAQVGQWAEAKGQRLCLELAPTLPLNGDRDKLARLFLNLLDNAIKYSPEGGQIIVNGRCTTGDEIVVEVQDEGPGLAAEDRAHLFDRFYRADAARSRASGGVGLGLAIAQSIALAHGGSILVSSEVGGGSIFSVRLPLCPRGHIPSQVARYIPPPAVSLLSDRYKKDGAR